jgi:hypothetical protein
MFIRKLPLLVVLLTLFAFTNISAAATYTVANVKGSYSFLANRWNTPSGGQGAEIGILNFDGAGAVTSGFMTVMNDGTLILLTVTSGSTYAVSPNGSGSMALNLTGGGINGTLPVGFVLNSVSGSIAKSLQLLELDSTNQSGVLAGTANLINLSGPATAAKLKGTYSILLNWWTNTAPQQAFVGAIKFDGASKVTLSFTERQGFGLATTGTGSGTYSVNPDGSGSINLTLSNGTIMQFDLVMNSIAGTSVAKGIQLLDVTDPSNPSVDTGTAVYE